MSVPPKLNILLYDPAVPLKRIGKTHSSENLYTNVRREGYSLESKSGNNLNVHQLMNAYKRGRVLNNETSVHLSQTTFPSTKAHGQVCCIEL